MESLTTRLTSSYANAYFGEEPMPFQSGNELAAMLRYIALKHHQGDLSDIKLTRADFDTLDLARDGNHILAAASNCDMFIAVIMGQRELPTIHEQGWSALDSKPYPVSQYLGAAEETKVYVNAELKKSIILVRRITSFWVRRLCSTLFRVLPWLYPTNPEGEELQVYEAFGEARNASSSIDLGLIASIMDEACKDIDFERLAITKMLADYKEIFVKNRIKTLEDNCGMLLRTMREYEEAIDNTARKLSDAQQELLVWQTAPQNKTNSISEFFLSRKQLRILSVNKRERGAINFGIVETLEYYDENIVKDVIKNGSYFEGEEFARKICDYVFGRHRGTFIVESCFRLVGFATLSPQQTYSDVISDANALPHPHLCHFGCLGGNKAYINGYLQKGDWESAIDQAIATTKNINFSDLIVMRHFVSDLVEFAEKRKCILADNGVRMTPREFVNYVEGIEISSPEGEDTNG